MHVITALNLFTACTCVERIQTRTRTVGIYLVKLVVQTRLRIVYTSVPRMSVDEFFSFQFLFGRFKYLSCTHSARIVGEREVFHCNLLRRLLTIRHRNVD